MQNHIYSFNGSLKKQQSGAAIGTTLAGTLAVMYMLQWCRKFKEKVNFATSEIEGFKILLLLYYIDDGNLITTTFPAGARLFEDGKVRIDPNQIESDMLIPADERTAKLLTEIGNSISNFIKLTADYPSKHENGFMPLLDIQVRVVDNQVDYKFYSKPMSNPYVILANSALPEQMKRNSLVQEAIRRLRNTKRDTEWETKAAILSEFVYKMKISGYSEKF